MRIVLVILSTAALLFIGGIVILTGMNDKNGAHIFSHQPNISVPAAPTGNTTSLDTLAVETLKHQMKTEQKLEELEKKLDQIAGKNIVTAPEITTLATSETPQIIQNEAVTIPISAKFLAKILPTIEPTKIENSGIF